MWKITRISRFFQWNFTFKSIFWECLTHWTRAKKLSQWPQSSWQIFPQNHTSNYILKIVCLKRSSWTILIGTRNPIKLNLDNKFGFSFFLKFDAIINEVEICKLQKNRLRCPSVCGMGGKLEKTEENRKKNCGVGSEVGNVW